MPASSRRTTLRRVLRAGLSLLAMLSVAAVLLASGAFVVLQNLDQYRDELAVGVGDMLGQPVTIGAANVRWQGASPILRLENLTIGGGGRSLSFRAAELRINPIESLRRRTLATSGVQILGATIQIARRTDGDFEMLGFGSSDSQETFDIDAARSLLAGPTHLTLANAELIYFPGDASVPPVKLALDMELGRADAGQRVSGAIRLPGRSQSYITAEGTFTFSTGGGWTTNLRVRSTGLLGIDVQRVLPEVSLPGSASLVAFDLQVQATEGRTLKADGRVSASSLRWNTDDPLGGPSNVAADARLSLSTAGWRAELRDIKAQGATTAWEASRGSLAYEFATPDREARYSATLSNGRLEDLLAVWVFLTPGDEALRALREPHATGTVIDSTVAWVDQSGEQVPFDVSATVRDLQWPAKGNRVGVSGLSGSVWLTHTGGRMSLNTTTGITINAPSVLRNPLPFDTALGELEIEIAPPNLTISTNGLTLTGPVLPLTLSGEVVRDSRADLLLDLDVASARLDVKTVQGLLPSERLPDELNEWLLNSVQGGTLTNVALRLLGRDSEVVASPESDSLRVSLDFADLAVDYEPGWPVIAGVGGSLTLRKGKLTIDTREQTIGGLPATMTAVIDNISADDPSLNVDATVTGPAKEMLSLLAATPSVDKQSADRLRAVPIRGQLALRTVVKQKLETDAQTVSATLRLKDNSIPATAGLPALTAISGSLDFNNGIISTKKLNVVVANEQTTLVGKVDLNAAPKGRIELRTQVPHQFWIDLVRDVTGSNQSPPAWLSNLQGRSGWILALDLEEDQPPRVSLSSDLRGIAIALPPPIGKAADTPATFRLSRSIGDDGTLRVTYADVVAGAYRPAPNDDDEFDLAVRLGPGKVPALTKGRWVARGRLSSFDTATLKFDPTDGRLDLRRLDLDVIVGSVSLGGADFSTVRLRTQTSANNEPQVQLTSDRISGVIVVPADAQAPLAVTLDRLDIPELQSLDEVPDVDPRSLPAMSFSVKSATYGGRDLGAAKFVALKSPTGVVIDKIYIIGEGFDAEGSASWTLDQGQHRTRLKATLNADTLSTLVKEVGYAGNVASGGPTQMVLDARWAVPPLAASLSNMSGELEFQAGAGRFNEVSPGAGAQLFGLLNLRVLPQLLTLNLGSLFRKGLEFDNIYGRFQIDNGQAYTNDLALTSPTAKVSFAGRTGIATQDYDQVATVVPALAGSLPAAGAAFGVVGAGVGAALWLVEKVTDTKVIDSVGAFQYTLTGSWENPKFERITAPQDEGSERSNEGVDQVD